jgi:hypothetical protein
MKITVIGVVPPCPRCQRIYDLALEAAEELGMPVEMKKLAYDMDEAQKYGKVGTAHDVAEWAEMEIDWSRIRSIVTEGWSKELDEVMMPCARKAEEQGWLMTPVLILDGKVAFMGYVPEKEDIKAAMRNAAGTRI